MRLPAACLLLLFGRVGAGTRRWFEVAGSMSERFLHGLEADKELQEEFLYRDTRSSQQKFSDWCKKPQNMAVLLLMHAVLAFFVPPISDFVLLLAGVFFLFAMRRKETAPLKMPAQSGLFDPNQNGKAKGIFFLGNQQKTGKEIWLTNDDCRQHFLVVGTTGAGKTETLLGFAANSLLWGSGLLFCDGKGDVSVFAKLYALTRRFGREDDLLVLNFMTGNSDIAGGGKIKSNTMNPFSTGSSDSLTQMVVSLMDDAGGDNAMWKGRATAMLTGVMRALCWLRDNGIIELNVGEIRDFMNLKKIIDLADPEKYPEMPTHIRVSIKSYLESLPGFDPKKGENQGNTTRDQHGFLEMQFTKILGSLADVYGHIFKTEYGEVDMTDVVLNRRILFIMLPALEKSQDELANLGKIVVANLKGMMGSNLGSDIEGSWYDVVENRQTTSRAPFLTILDEVGYYAVEGLALMAAQARSLGFSMVYATQDIPAIERGNEKEAASIIANTNTKIFMRTEEVEKSGKLAVEAAGKAIKAQVGSFQGKAGELSSGYSDSREARLEMADRVSFRDLKQQTEGEMHIIHKDLVVRARGLYANPEGSLDTRKLSLRANHFIRVVPPDPEDLEADERLPEIMEKLVSPAFPKELKAKASKLCAVADKDMIDEIALARHMFKQMDGAKRSLTEAGGGTVGAVAEILSRNVNAFTGNVRNIISTQGNAASDSEEVPLRNTRQELLHAAQEQRSEIDPDTDDLPPQRPTSFSELQKNALKRARKRSRLQDTVHGATIDDDDPIDMSDTIESNDTIMRALQAMNFEVEEETKDSVQDKIDNALALQDDTVAGEGDDDPVAVDDLILASGEVDDALADIIEDDDAFATLEDGEEGGKDPAKTGNNDLAEDFLRYLMVDDETDGTEAGSAGAEQSEEEEPPGRSSNEDATGGSDKPQTGDKRKEDDPHVNQDALAALEDMGAEEKDGQ